MKKLLSTKWRPVMLAALLSVLIALSAVAQAPPPQGQPESPESQPGVGRISVIDGNVSTQHSDSAEWIAATPNLPVVPGDSVSTGPRSSAEIQLDYANVLRLSENASARIANLLPNQIQVQVGQGLVNYSAVRPGEAGVEIDTPNVAIHPTGPGSYRIQVNPDGETQLTVRSGAADVSTPQGSTRVESGQLITIRGTDDPQYQTFAAPATDAWDRWNGDRDRQIVGAASWQHTTPYYVGTQDLDPYGTWTNDTDYGNVWIPAQEPGWAPYRAGRWVWEPYYGWTWVSYEPWGWAPYHYGRWFLHGASWAWWPGPVMGYPGYRPLWAPAYVSMFGFGGGGIGVGVGFGNIGWLPIGPGDFFFPWYGRWGARREFVRFGDHDFDGRRYNGIGPLRERGFSNMNAAFVNDRVRSGMTSMASNQFGRGGVPIHQQAISPVALRQGGLMTGGLGISPSRESLRPTDRAVNPASIPSRAPSSQRFFSQPRGSSASQPFGGQSARTNPGITNPGSSVAQVGRAFGGATAGTNRSPAANPASAAPGVGNMRSGNQASSTQAFSSTRGQSPASPSGWQGFRGAPSGNGSTVPNNRPSAGGPYGASPRQGGWPPVSAPSRQTPPETGGRNFGGPNGMQASPYRSAPSLGTGIQGSASGPRGYSRPPLDLRQPIVTQRSGGVPSGFNRGGGGGPRGAPSGGGGHGGGGGGGRLNKR